MSSTAPQGALTTTDGVGNTPPYAKRWAAAIGTIPAALPRPWPRRRTA
ncbi:hypothetical protein ACFV23_38435 [Streptomyces sp. NPDC059627]